MGSITYIRKWFNEMRFSFKTSKKIEKDSPEIISVQKQIIHEKENAETFPQRRHKRQAPPPPRIPECALLFVGLDSSGISSTISTIFGLEIETVPNHDGSIQEISGHLNTYDDSTVVKIVDVPGFCKGKHIEQDAELVLGLKSYLASSIPNQIPNVVFITTRFEDNRFEGEGSNFTKMLTALKHSCTSWTDTNLSNIILVLTNSSKVKQDREKKLLKFQEAFHKIFLQSETKVVECVLVDNLEDIKESRRRLITKIEAVRDTRQDHILKESFIEHLSKGENEEMILNPIVNSTPIIKLLPPNRREVNQLLDLLLQGISVPFPVSPLNNVQDFSVHTLFRSYWITNNETIKDYKFYNPTRLSRHTHVVLADHSVIQVSDLNVGDRLLNAEFQACTITRISKAPINGYDGRYFVAEHDFDDQVKLYKYVKSLKRIRKVNYKAEVIKNLLKLGRGRENYFYEIELDLENDCYYSILSGTFIADDYLVYNKQHTIEECNERIV